MTTVDAHRLGVYLWRSSLTERVASGIFHAASASPLLTREMRGRAAQYAEEESGHGDLLREAGRRYLVTRPDAAPPLFDAHGLAVHLGLGWVYQAERISRPGFEISRRHFWEIGDKVTAAAYERIFLEERPHIALGREFLRHLKANEPALHAEVLRFWVERRLISSRYREVAGDRPWAKEKGADPKADALHARRGN